MNKELEALEKIDHTICLNSNGNLKFNIDNEEHIDCVDLYEYVDCYETIKSALKRKEELEKFVQKHQKEHQAISILKSKYINLFVFNLSSTYDEYCKLIGDRCCISEKEYKLLKEVFKRL